jgi:peroxiredoxin
MTLSLKARLTALHEERVRTWDPAKLQINIDQRRELVEAFDASRIGRVGDEAPPFALLDTQGGTITRDALTATGPAVLIFFRFAGCPACNIALPYYQETLWPELQARGIPLVAVSPQVPERLDAIRERHGLGFRVASDPGNRLARQLGITYHANAASRAGGAGPGWIGEVTGTGTWELPQPAVVILEQSGRIAWIDVSPDWLARTESDVILSRLGPSFSVAA